MPRSQCSRHHGCHDELVHLRQQVSQMEDELKNSHHLAQQKSFTKLTLKQQIDHLMQKVAASRARGPQEPGQDVTETALVPVNLQSGSVKMFGPSEEADKKRLRVPPRRSKAIFGQFVNPSLWCRTVGARYGLRGI